MAPLLHCGGQVSWAQMATSVGVFGEEYVRDHNDGEGCLLDGKMQVLELETGLLLYCTQVMDQCDIRTSNWLHPSLKLLVLLEGHTQVRYGAQWFDLDATRQPYALLVHLQRPDIFMRQWQRTRTQRKLLLSMDPAWLQRKGLDNCPLCCCM